MRNNSHVTGISAINPLVAFYDIHGGKIEVLFFCSVPDTTRDKNIILLSHIISKDVEKERLFDNLLCLIS
jgi:hypothetical protein